MCPVWLYVGHNGALRVDDDAFEDAAVDLGVKNDSATKEKDERQNSVWQATKLHLFPPDRCRNRRISGA